MGKEKNSASIEIEGSVETNGGHIAGRDVFNIALNIIQENLPKNDPLPQEMKKALNSLQILISTLRAWKEVHNSLDEIRSSFDQFRLPIERADAKKQITAHKYIKLSWMPVFSKIQTFQNRVIEVNKKENSFSESNIITYEDRRDDVIECQKKSYMLIGMSKDLNLHITESYGHYSIQSISPEYEYVILNIKRKIGLRNHWWLYLTDLTDQLDNNLTESMYVADKLLRSTADHLFTFSQEFLGIKGISR